MRTYLHKKLKRILKWLEIYLISRKKHLTSREAAIYLNTSLGYIYRLTGQYHLPYYKTSHHLLYFKRKEIDLWKKNRFLIDFRVPVRKQKKAAYQPIDD